ncbi:hypothetical protein M5D96_008592 [Drosophila gunungcola]|uniref:ATP synthase F1 subunit epsilon n=1 Tax=Drosophila gunungcola TaxID=103775 RepID=A0A9P9YLD5_9MUSC|nr:hypothetical protein M5D96_008592 [Drosophila gunungcola]
MYSLLSCTKMFCAGLMHRRVSLGLSQTLGLIPKKLYSEEKKPPNVFLWGGGLGKLQGGLKEEEYFISLTQELIGKMRDKKDFVDYIPNWDEFQKTLDHTSLGSSSFMTKHKNVLEEAFFLNEVGELGSGAGKGGGGGGAIREAGGSFGKMEAAREEEFFYKQMPGLESQMETVLTGSPECAVQVPASGMAATIQNTLKVALRKRMKDALKNLDTEAIARQSRAVTAKATRVSIYLSTTSELDTTALLCEMFRLEKMVFVPTYEGTKMKMVRLRGMDEYENLPLTKWNIKQPDFKEAREDAMTNGHGIDLFIVPGVAFTRTGARLGHGMGYYDKFLKQHADNASSGRSTSPLRLLISGPTGSQGSVGLAMGSVTELVKMPYMARVMVLYQPRSTNPSVTIFSCEQSSTMKVVAGIAVLICLFIEAEEGSAYLLESECGTKKQSDMGPKIKGGKDADPFSNPWMVRLIVESPICGGSLITCIRLGEYDTMNPENSYEIEADLKVVHQGYNYDPTTYKYDIGLLRPICLAVHEPIRPIIPFMIAGWGQSESGQSSNILQTAYVHLISQSICSHHYTRHVGRSQLCAYDQTSDACAGDSGGPLSAELQLAKMSGSQVGDLGSGAGRGGGGGGAIREAGGAFGKLEAAREEEYFYKKQREQLDRLKNDQIHQAEFHHQQIKEHEEAIQRHKEFLENLHK